MQLPELSTLLNYKNDRLIHYYCYHHSDITKSMANQYFVDLLAWFWLNAYRQHQKKQTYLFGPLLVLDELWHAFILHTRDYHEFCEAFFSSYIHHDIELIGQEHQLSAEEIEDFLEDSFNFLGEAWVLRYFSDLLDEGSAN